MITALWLQECEGFQLIFRIGRGIPFFFEGYPNSWDTWDIRYCYYHIINILSHDNIICYCVIICLVCGPGDGSRWWAPKCKARRECESLEPVGTDSTWLNLKACFCWGSCKGNHETKRGDEKIEKFSVWNHYYGIGIDSEWFASGW